MTDDDLVKRLTPRPAAGPDERGAAIAASSRVIRRRARYRTVARRGGVAALAVAAFCTGRWSAPDPAPVTVTEVVVVTREPEPTAPVPQNGPPPAEVEPSPERLELRAELANDPADVAALYRRAGDAFLASRADVKQAVRCYRLHLAALPPDGRSLAADDSWLLISMKH